MQHPQKEKQKCIFTIVILIPPTALEGSIRGDKLQAQMLQTESRWRLHDGAAVLLGRQLQWTARSTDGPQPGVLVGPRGYHRHLLRGPAHFTAQRGGRRVVMWKQLSGTTWTKEP